MRNTEMVIIIIIFFLGGGGGGEGSFVNCQSYQTPN